MEPKFVFFSHFSENVDFVIPGNDDAIRSIEVIATAIADACLKGLGKREDVEVGEDKE